MKKKAKDIQRGDVVDDRQIVAVPLRVAQVDRLPDGVVMIRYALRRKWFAYDENRELEVR